MENRVKFYSDQDLSPEDLNGLQTCVSDTFDDLVGDVVTANRRYAGLLVTMSSEVTRIGIGPGTLYVAGKMYDLAAAITQNFLTSLPAVGQKWVVVVASPHEADTDVTPREFLLDEATGQSQAKPVPLRSRRICRVQFAEGAEGPSPALPQIDPGYVPVANVLLGPAAVISITMRDEYRVGNLDEHGDRIDDLEAFEEAVGAKVSTLASDLAALSKQLGAQTPSPLVGQMLTRLADIEAKTGIPAAAVSSHTHYFLDGRGSDLANPISNCQVREGIRFPDENRGIHELALLNPLNPDAKLNNGVLLPAYNRAGTLRLPKPSAGAEIRLSGYTYQTTALVQKTMTREVINYGPAFTRCTNTAWWQSGTYDARAGLFTREGETFTVDLTAESLGQLQSGRVHNVVRLQKYWKTTTQENYWDAVKTDHSVNGTVVAETFLQSQDMWLESVGLYFTRLADAGDARVAICECRPDGTPDPLAVIGQTTLQRSAMKAGAETVVPLTPTFLTAGKRYALLVITTGDHWVATVPGESFTQGTLFYILDGAYAQGDGTKDLWFQLYRAVPKQARTSIQLENLQLDGGILGISINADAIVPGGDLCRLIYEIQVAGRWYDLQDADAYTLGQGGSLPPNLGFRITFLGTGDIMPGVVLTGSEVVLTRPAKTLLHPSPAVPLPGVGSSQIRVMQRYESWDATHHTAGVKLRTGATFATIVSPTSYTDVTGDDPFGGPYLERTYLFNLGAAVTAFKVQTEGTTDTNRKTYHVAAQKDWAL